MVKGRYRWNFLFDLQGPLKETVTSTFTSKVSAMEFRQNLVKESRSHSLTVSASAEYNTLSFSAKASASYTGEFHYHSEFIEKVSRNTETTESTEVKSEFEIPKGERRRVYYLVYSMPGVEKPFNVFTDVKDPKEVEVDIECTVQIDNNTMYGGDVLEAGKYLSSTNDRYRLIM